MHTKKGLLGLLLSGVLLVFLSACARQVEISSLPAILCKAAPRQESPRRMIP